MTPRILLTEEEKKEKIRIYNASSKATIIRVAWNKTVSQCDCGKQYTNSHKNQHKNKCVWHINYMLSLNTDKPLPKYGTEGHKEYIRQIEIEQLKELRECPRYQEILKSQNKVLSEDKSYVIYR